MPVCPAFSPPLALPIHGGPLQGPLQGKLPPEQTTNSVLKEGLASGSLDVGHGSQTVPEVPCLPLILV